MRFLLLAAAIVAVGCGSANERYGTDEVEEERAPRKIATLSGNEGTAVGIAVDRTHAFVTTRGDTRGSIVKAPLAGGAYEVLASVDPEPYAIALDDEWVYFTVRDTGRVHRVRKTGGLVELVAEEHERANGAEAIAVEGAYVYWTAVGGVFRALKASSTHEAERIAEDSSGATALAVEGGEAFWIARGTTGDPQGALYKVKVSGGEKVTLGTGAIFMPTWGFSIAVSGRFVFVPDTNGGRVYRVDRSTGELALVAEGQDVPTAIAADAGRVYWSTGGASGSRLPIRTLSSAPIAGGPLERLVVTSQANVFAIASNGSGVFFTDYVATGSIYAAR